MNIEYHKWWSPSLEQEMELKTYGWFGKPVLVFPAQGGSFHEFEDMGMVDVISGWVETGKIKLFTVNSVDDQSWANWGAHPADRARRHLDYEQYIIHEVVPFVREHCGDTGEKFMATGVSMGGYHSANFFFKNPDIFDTVISMSGIFRLRMFIGDYMDENVYYNSPLHYLQEMEDPWYLEQYRQSRIVISVGQGRWEEEMLDNIRDLSSLMQEKNIPCWIDHWGYDVDHDWPWWKKMLPYFMEKLGF